MTFKKVFMCHGGETHIAKEAMGRETTGPLGSPAVLRRELYILYQKLKGTVFLNKVSRKPRFHGQLLGLFC